MSPHSLHHKLQSPLPPTPLKTTLLIHIVSGLVQLRVNATPSRPADDFLLQWLPVFPHELYSFLFLDWRHVTGLIRLDVQCYDFFMVSIR